MNTEKQEFAALTEKQEWLNSQARKRAKRKKVLKYICVYTIMCYRNNCGYIFVL